MRNLNKNEIDSVAGSECECRCTFSKGDSPWGALPNTGQEGELRDVGRASDIEMCGRACLAIGKGWRMLDCQYIDPNAESLHDIWKREHHKKHHHHH